MAFLLFRVSPESVQAAQEADRSILSVGLYRDRRHLSWRCRSFAGKIQEHQQHGLDLIVARLQRLSLASAKGPSQRQPVVVPTLR
jgi:hypothetical protein